MNRKCDDKRQEEENHHCTNTPIPPLRACVSVHLFLYLCHSGKRSRKVYIFFTHSREYRRPKSVSLFITCEVEQVFSLPTHTHIHTAPHLHQRTPISHPLRPPQSAHISPSVWVSASARFQRNSAHSCAPQTLGSITPAARHRLFLHATRDRVASAHSVRRVAK